MKKLTALLAAGLVLGMSGQAMAANATSTAEGEVIAPIAIASTANLAFGKFAAGTAGGTIKVDTDGAITVTGGPTGVIKATGSTGTAAQFNVTGQALNTYSIAHTGTAVLTNTTGNETMALAKVSALTAATGTTTEVSSGTLSAGGAETIFVGGTLTVGAAQVPGAYAGTVIVTVEYN